MQASLTRRTVFTVTAKGNGNSANHGFFDETKICLRLVAAMR
jgi:hypothetical protein